MLQRKTSSYSVLELNSSTTFDMPVKKIGIEKEEGEQSKDRKNKAANKANIGINLMHWKCHVLITSLSVH